MRPLIATFVLATLFAYLEASAALSYVRLNDETMLTGDRELSVEVKSRLIGGHSLTFECAFGERDEAGDVSMHLMSYDDKARLGVGEQIVKLKFDDGPILDAPSVVEEHGRKAYRIKVLFSSEQVLEHLRTSISSEELTYGLLTVEGEMVQGTVGLRGAFDQSRIMQQLFDMRCKHPEQPIAVSEFFSNAITYFRLRDEVQQDGRRDLRVSGGRGTRDGYEFRCLSGERTDPVMLLVHLESRKPRSGHGKIKLEFEGGAAIDAEARISHGVIHANVVVRQAREIFDEAMTSGEFTVHIQGRKWDFRAGDLWLEVFRNRCLLE